MRAYQSRLSQSIHRTATDLYESGIITEDRMRAFDDSCLVPSMRPEEIRDLREREALSRQDFARELQVSTDLVGRWEQGKSTPSPVAMKLLDLVRRKGIEGIR